MTTKICPDCKESKPHEDFGFRNRSKTYINAYCKPCDSVRRKARRKANPEKYKMVDMQSRVKYLYGLTIDEYKEKLSSGCEVCGITDDLCVDHDHACCSGARSCGKCIRGVLCRNHNKILGYVSDSVEELQALIDYLNKTVTAAEERGIQVILP